jgi:hypothetical protein
MAELNEGISSGYVMLSSRGFPAGILITMSANEYSYCKWQKHERFILVYICGMLVRAATFGDMGIPLGDPKVWVRILD